MKTTPFVLILLVFLALPAMAQDRREVAARAILNNWTAEGIVFKTGFETDGTQNLVVLAQESFATANGYFPLQVTAKAGVKSVLRVYTRKTLGCSRSFRLPQWEVATTLDATGVKEFPLPAMKKGTRLVGLCAMGMYSFVITFS